MNSGKVALYSLATVVAIGLIALLTSIRVVGTGQVGVVTSFGQVTGRELDEGLSLVAPFGINSVSVYDVKVQKEESQNAAASADLQDANATVVVNYRLERGKVSEVHRTIGEQYNDKVMKPVISEAFKAVSSNYSATRLITERAKVKAEALKSISDRVKKYGIVVEDVSMTNFAFSEEFTKSIEAKQVAQQNAERAKFNLEAARTDAEAQKAQSATLSKEYLQKLAIDKWNGTLPQYLGGGSVFNIPLR